jgi:glycosyltransferase involved in cell wall biosynthesis
MPRCRIYLFTYNRHDLLPRALNGLINQTFGDWTCELHNDMPGDDFPETCVQRLGDARIEVINHVENVGVVGSFNLAFGPCTEDFVSILEDDNWWEPDFLEKMIQLMDRNPGVQVAWANMRLHQELEDGSWKNLQQTIWPTDQSSSITEFYFPVAQQACVPLHSNGAMMIRNIDLQLLQTPDNLRADFMEHVRERAFRQPLVLVNEPLANFAITRKSARPGNRNGIAEHYFLLLCSFFSYAGNDRALVCGIWEKIRQSPVMATHNLIYAGIFDKHCRSLLKEAGITDWLFFIAFQVRHPSMLIKISRSKKKYPELWKYLNLRTAVQFAGHPHKKTF